MSGVPPLDYPVVIEPLATDDGGGYVTTVPDLPGCMAGGDSPEQALANTREAIAEWLAQAHVLGRHVPSPSLRPADTDES
jgi:antitoxin HicB